MPGRELSFKLYIEGIEVPFINAQITATANAASQMTITMVPAPSIWDIRPRSLVHLFFLDDYEGPEPDGTTQTNSVFRLLWEGEVVGVSYSKTPDQRNVGLQCVDLSNYWDYTQQYFLSSIKHGIPTADRRIFFGSTEVKFNILLGMTPWFNRFFTEGVNLADSILGIVKNFTSGLIYWETLNTRLGLADKIFAIDDDRINKLIDAVQLNQMINGMLGQLGGRATLTNILNHLKQLIYYVHVPIIAPPFRLVKRNVDPTLKAGADPVTTQELVGTTTSFVFKPNIYMTAPPRCNVLFPDQITSLQYSRMFMAEPTRLWMTASHALSPQTGEDEPTLFQAVYYAPASLREALTVARTDPEKAKEIIAKQLIAQQLYGSTRLIEQQAEASSVVAKDLAAKTDTVGGKLPSFMTEEEYEKGILPLSIKLPFAKYAAIAQDNDKLKKNLQQVAEYQLQLSRFTPRSLTVTTEFNPWLVLSFPCAVFDASRSYFGNIVNITHQIDSTGGAFTMISCNMAREMVEDDEEIPTLPAWLNKAYHPVEVAGRDGTYRQLLGCDALGPNNPGSKSAILTVGGLDINTRTEKDVQDFLDKTDNQFDLAKVANLLFQLKKPASALPEDLTGEYDLAAVQGDSYQFSREYQRRDVATIAEIFGEVYQLGVKESTVAPPSVPVTGSDTSLAGSSELERTPFNYKPQQDLADQVRTRRRKEGKLIGNLTTAGHKRDPIIRYVEETREIIGVDGS